MWNITVSSGSLQISYMVQVLKVCINVFSTQEVYGEDPYLASRLTVSYVKGLHGYHPRYVQASSGCKVIGLYSGPENHPSSRFKFNAEVSLHGDTICMHITILRNERIYEH